MQHKGANDVRKHFAQLLDAAERGRSTIITRRGRPVAALVPMPPYKVIARQQSLLPLAGTGRGLWGKNSARTLRKMRDE